MSAKKRRKKACDSVLTQIEQELCLGRFIRYGDMFDFVRHLEKVEETLESLVGNGEAERAVGLYEAFLAGCYDKIEECDDSGANLSMFWHGLFCGWVRARQAAGRPAGETVEQILRWRQNDNYGFCYRIEKDVAKTLDTEGYRLFVQHFEGLVDNALAGIPEPKPTAIFEHENNVRLPALSLKDIYEAKGGIQMYATLCDRTGLSPKDCERLAEMEMSKKRWKQALAWVEKGLKLETTRDWHNESSFGLASKKPKILAKLGRKEESLAIAWADFDRHPSDQAYAQFMEYVPKTARKDWHRRAMERAAQGDMGNLVDICVATREWDILASSVLATSDGALENISHYTLEPAAEGLVKRDVRASAKLYCALGFRILTSKKSKYYNAALSHFRHARDLYRKANLDNEWQVVVDRIYAEHSRKYGFMPDFENLVAGKTECSPSFAEKTRARWQQQAGGKPESAPFQ